MRVRRFGERGWAATAETGNNVIVLACIARASDAFRVSGLVRNSILAQSIQPLPATHPTILLLTKYCHPHPCHPPFHHPSSNNNLRPSFHVLGCFLKVLLFLIWPGYLLPRTPSSAACISEQRSKLNPRITQLIAPHMPHQYPEYIGQWWLGSCLGSGYSGELHPHGWLQRPTRQCPPSNRVQ